MNEFAKTGIALGAAVVLTALAVTMKPGEVRLDLYEDQGQEFFPEFKSGDAIAELEVTAFRAETSDVYPFLVKRGEDGVWTIPSHYNYPADATDQMGKAAAMLIGLRKESVVGDAKGRHADYGVVDPLAEGVETEGRGKRVKVKDKAGNVLADLIVGNEVEDKPGVFYVRVPDKKRVYKTKLSGSLSTQFADWIETDLLQAKSWNIQKIVFDNYSIDEVKGQIVPGDKLVVARGADNKFVLEGVDAAKEETSSEKTNEIANTLGQIKIVGVRPKPDGLTARLERANGFEAAMLRQQLQDKGYFLAQGGKLVSNEGDLIFETKSGVRYTLRFGELVAGEGDEVTAGIGAKADGEQASKDNASNRYLMVTAEFLAELLDQPDAPRLAADELTRRKDARAAIEKITAAIEQYRAANEGKLPASLQDLTTKPAEGEPLLAALEADPWGRDYQYTQEGDTYVVSSFGKDGEAGGAAENKDVSSAQLAFEDSLDRAATEWQTYDEKVKTGQEEADKLTKRFGPWYYVIAKSTFDDLKPARADLVQPKAEDAAPESGK